MVSGKVLYWLYFYSPKTLASLLQTILYYSGLLYVYLQYPGSVHQRSARFREGTKMYIKILEKNNQACASASASELIGI